MNPSGFLRLAGLVLIGLPLVLPAPDGVPDTAWIAAGLALAMALWWLTEALPLAATALLPLAAAPLVGLADFKTVAGAYSHPLIFLFLGGFLLARAIESSGLHRRLAGALLGLAGESPGRSLAAIMVATAFLSLWISNTASAMVVTPIAAAVATTQAQAPRFGTALMLGVAFSATIGGMGSLIGTPPNALFAAHVSAQYGVDVGFAQWAAVGIPVSLLLLGVAWLVLARLTPGLGGATLTAGFEQDLSPMRPAERRVAWVGGLTALAWIARPWLDAVLPLSDSGIAMIAAMALFLLPDGQDGRLLDWGQAKGLRWDVLILFGGGLALAALLESSGLAAWIGARVDLLHGLPQILLVTLIATLIVYVGELASNTAMAAIFLPIAGAAAVSMDLDPVVFLLPVALAASIGFMLPVATPPNAIVFATPAVDRSAMLRAGAPLDIVGIVIAIAISSVLAPLVFG